MKNIILCGIQLKSENAEIWESYLNEAEALCAACGLNAAGMLVQKSASVDVKTGFRSGKIEELSAMIQQLGADGVVIVNNLSVSAEKRLSEAVGVEVIDRTALILNIFSKRARSHQAKVQVEMARLSYALPSIGTDIDREGHSRGGGYRNRGAGEMRSAKLASTYKSRIRELSKQLHQIEESSRSSEIRRSKSTLARCAIVGYTNAGKSSLLNALLRKNQRADEQVLEKDQLFATLDPSVRKMTYHGLQFLLYDTVGFVSNLPRQLLDAFHATLEAAANADLLIHVVDASDPLWERKAQITRETLKQIGAGDIPVITVFSKIDLVKELPAEGGLCISSRSGEGLDALLDEVVKKLYPMEETVVCRIPYDKMALADAAGKTMHVEWLSEEEDGVRLRISGQSTRLMPYEQYREKEVGQ